MLLLLSFFPSLTIAQLRFDDAQHSELITSPRALALGNAYIAKSQDTDASSIFYNPASLTAYRRPQFRLSNFHVEWNKYWMDLATEGSIFRSLAKFRDAFSLKELRNLLQEKT